MSILPEFSLPQFSLPDFSFSDLSIAQLQMPNVTIFGMTWFYNEEVDEAVSTAAIDLGNGHFLEAPDVLDSHFRRLMQEADSVDLTEAIDSLAPPLAPLAHLANDLAHEIPRIQPDTVFRKELQQRLEAAHQQQATEDGYAVYLWHCVSEHYVLAGIPVIVGLIACARYFYTKESS